MAVASDCSELPKEFLNQLSKRLHNEIDLIRFRSVCSHWRTSSISNHHNTLPFKLPLLKYDTYRNTFTIDNHTSSFSYLSKRTHFLIKSSSQDQTLIPPPWLIRITQNSYHKTILFHPQFSYSLPSYYFRLTHLDFNKLSLIKLGTDFVIDNGHMYPKKILAVTPLILAILLDNHRLVLFRCGSWIDTTNIPYLSSSSFRDICIFKGRIYAVQVHGRLTIAVGPEDLSVQLVANPGGMGRTKLLVESEGQLLLVESESTEENDLMINVFRLDERFKKWVKLMSLGDRILFLGNGCSFSVSASDLSVTKGNCLVFMDNDCILVDKICNNATGMCVFDLDQGRLSPLSDYPEYLNLLWPPPEWIIKSHMRSKTKKGGKQRKRTGRHS